MWKRCGSSIGVSSLTAVNRLVLAVSRRWQSGTGFDDEQQGENLHLDLQSELAKVMSETTEQVASQSAVGSHQTTGGTMTTQPSAASNVGDDLVQISKLSRPPAKFDLITNSFAYEWQTTARLARKVIGPMREWANELKYRTGVHLEMDPTHLDKLASGDYATADEVEVTVYLFGTDRGVAACKNLMDQAVQQEPAYVRLGVFRRNPSASSADSEVEWLMLRRINRDNRPPDIPKISLKLPGKYTLMHENYKECALRTLWEETGISVQPASVYPSGFLFSSDPTYYWRVPVRYFVAEVPHDAKPLGPQTAKQMYMQGWDPRILRQSPDPIDREWARLADPETGCAWVKSSLIDELQKPLRGEYYMSTRYTPPPHSNLQEVVKLNAPPASPSS